MSLNSVIASFQTGTYDITRKAVGTFTDGKYTVGSTSTIAGIVMCIQPVTGRDLKAMPEGQSAEESRVIYTETELFVRAPVTDSDIITIDGEPWLVTKCERWQHWGETHYRAYAARQRQIVT